MSYLRDVVAALRANWIAIGLTAIALVWVLSLQGCSPEAVVRVYADGTCQLHSHGSGSTQLITRPRPHGGVECTVVWELPEHVQARMAAEDAQEDTCTWAAWHQGRMAC